MRPIRNTAQVFAAIQHGKAGASEFCTNFFPPPDNLQEWIDRAELRGSLTDGAASFLRKDRDFWHYYFCATSSGALQQALPSLPMLRRAPVVADLIGHEAELTPLVAVFESVGFHRHKRLFRMARLPQPAPPAVGPDSVDVDYAHHADADAILGLLTRSFDRYAEQLPFRQEIDAAICRRRVLVTRSDGMLAGLLYFETKGVASTIRYWLVDEQFRTRRLGTALIRRYFAINIAVRRFVLWVIADNADTIAIYRHLKYSPDGLIDHVMANEMIQS